MAVVSPVVFLGLYSFTVKKAPAITFLVLAVRPSYGAVRRVTNLITSPFYLSLHQGLMLLSALLLMFKIQRPF